MKTQKKQWVRRKIILLREWKPFHCVLDKSFVNCIMETTGISNGTIEKLHVRNFRGSAVRVYIVDILSGVLLLGM